MRRRAPAQNAIVAAELILPTAYVTTSPGRERIAWYKANPASVSPPRLAIRTNVRGGSCAVRSCRSWVSNSESVVDVMSPMQSKTTREPRFGVRLIDTRIERYATYSSLRHRPPRNKTYQTGSRVTRWTAARCSTRWAKKLTRINCDDRTYNPVSDYELLLAIELGLSRKVQQGLEQAHPRRARREWRRGEWSSPQLHRRKRRVIYARHVESLPYCAAADVSSSSDLSSGSGRRFHSGNRRDLLRMRGSG